MQTVPDLCAEAIKSLKTVIDTVDGNYLALPVPIDPTNKSAGQLVVAVSKSHVRSPADAAAKVAALHRKHVRAMEKSLVPLGKAGKLLDAMDTAVSEFEAGGVDFDTVPMETRGLFLAAQSAATQGLTDRKTVARQLRNAIADGREELAQAKSKTKELRSTLRIAARSQAGQFMMRCADNASGTDAVRYAAKAAVAQKRCEFMKQAHRKAFGRH